MEKQVIIRDGSKYFSVSGRIGDNQYWRLGPFKTRQEAEECIKGKEESDVPGM